jgi:hypothetical protein
MGKRKISGHTYYQCDFTGFPMKNTNCYLPSWTADGKLQKKGSFCNWESVIAQLYAQEMAFSERQNALAHIEGIIGEVRGTEAPAIEKLAHLDGELTAERYHSECCYQTNEISVVILNDTQHTETTIDSNDGVFDFAHALGRNCQPSKVYSYRKGKADKDLCIFYHPEQEGTVNAKASQLLKMRIYGPALLVQCSKETSFLPRERFVSYTQEMYEAQYTKKRKEKKVQHMETGDYESAKKDMQKELNTFEAKQSQRALPPKELAAVTKMAPMSGHALAEMHPPPVRRQVSVM